MSINIIRAFEQLRQLAFENKDLAKRITELEHYFMQHCQDNEIDVKNIYEALEILMDRTKPSKIGFVKNNEQF